MKKITGRTWTFLGIPAIFLLGSLMHFIYDLTGKNFVVGLFAPVNESVFEHMKMVPLPMLLWWSIYYLFAKEKTKPNSWFTAALTALITALVTVPLLYYFYTGAFGVELMWVDISILLIAVLLGQTLGYHVYKSDKFITKKISLGIIFGIIVLFGALTLYPPFIPMFKDASTGLYGIWKNVNNS